MVSESQPRATGPTSRLKIPISQLPGWVSHSYRVAPFIMSFGTHGPIACAQEVESGSQTGITLERESGAFRQPWREDDRVSRFAARSIVHVPSCAKLGDRDINGQPIDLATRAECNGIESSTPEFRSAEDRAAHPIQFPKSRLE